MLFGEVEVKANIRNRDGKRVFYLGKGDQLTSGAKDYLSRERISKLEKAMRAAKLARVASSFLGQSGLLNISGR